MPDTSKTPIEQPTAKEWFEPGYVHKPPSKVIRPDFGKGLPPAKEEQTGGEVS